MLELLVPHPEHKLLSIRNIPQTAAEVKSFSTYQWHGLLKHLHQMLISNSPIEEGKYLPEHIINVQVLLV